MMGLEPDQRDYACAKAEPSPIAEQVVSEVVAFIEGRGPDREAEHLALDEIDAEGVHSLWADARKEKAAQAAKAQAPMRRPKAEVLDPPAAQVNGATASFILPDAQPKAEPEPITLSTVLETSADPLVRFGNVAPKANAAPALLTHSSPYDTAKEYVKRHCFREGVLATYFWQDQFWEWNGRHYEVLATEIIRDRAYAFLDASQKVVGADGLAKFKPTPKLVNDVLDALKSGLALPNAHQPPMWLDTREAAADVLVFRDGLVNVLTGERMPLTPRLWMHSAVDYDYDPQAACHEWEKFLEQVFPGDQASQDCIEEQLGYGMTEQTKFEKAALWVGPKRSGKGTIAFIQRKLIGDAAYVGLSFSTWVVNENSKECLIGKRVGVFPDVRFKPGKHYGASYDAGGITHTSAELLLNIVGQDHITIGRKYSKAWHGQLRLKLILISNEVPNLNDTQGILPSRFIKVKFTQSFFGKEDVDLRKKLEAELSGIAARCMTAYRRLIARGKFVQPESGVELERKVLAESDPYTAFVNDVFVIDPAGTVSCGMAKTKFEIWCRDRGRFDVFRSTSGPSQLTQRLKGVAGLEQLRSFRPHGQPRAYAGIRLKTRDEREAEPQ